jgi:hypothetical protein
VPPAGLHLRGCSGDLGHGLDRLAEQVAVVEPRAAAERAHLGPQIRFDERVDDDRGPAARSADGRLEVLDALDHRMPDLLERLLGKLRLERMDEPRGGLAGRIGDDVELDRLIRHLTGA